MNNLRYASGPACGPETADIVIYGATPTGVAAAVAAAANGLAVMVVGGWRDRHAGGMMSGGLGWTDVDDIRAFGGFARHTMEALAKHGGMPRNRYAFDPKDAAGHFSDCLRLAGVPFIRSDGVVDAQVVDRRIQWIATADGRRFTGQMFIDASYEGDLIAHAGVSTVVGREERTPDNRLSGFRGAMHLAKRGGESGPLWLRARVDPFRVEGDRSSGLLGGVTFADRAPTGEVDDAVPAYNFRMAMTNREDRRIDLPSTPPEGSDDRWFEPHLRYIAALENAGLKHGRDWTFARDIVKADEVADGVFDVNNRGYFSTDLIGMSWDYPEADYARREQIWKRHETYTRGLFHTLGWSKDPRLPDSFQREVRQWGLIRGHFDEPHPNDSAGWPYQLYVREARRMDNGLRWSGADLDTADHIPPRNVNTVAMACYMQDSHAVQRVAVEDADGTWALMNEGGFGVPTGGKDRRALLPYELMVPHRDQCTNLLSPFCVASSHQAFSAIRMEMTAMAMGEAAGLAASLMLSNRQAGDFQDVEYAALRRRLIANGAVLTRRADWEMRVDRLTRKLRRFVRA